jgi:formylglycine-generating enzyme required for sulfatase activity
MVEVPGGKFLMGCLPALDGECNHSYERQHEVELDAYVIDRTEVTVADYRACAEAGRCSTDGLDSQTALGGYTVDCNWKAAKDKHPINCIDWAGAAAYCAFAGKRLPTEAEWEKAARGSDGRIYPWGNERPGREGRDDERVVLLELRAPSIRDKPPRREYVNSTWPVGSRPAGKSPYGALDMLGNVWEWTADWFDRSAYEASVRRNPQGPSSGTVRVVRGGHDALTMRVSERLQLGPAMRSGLVGFRCARSARQP